MAGTCICAPDSGAVDAAVVGTNEATEGEKTVILDTGFAESATASVEGRARQTDREVAGPIWAFSLD